MALSYQTQLKNVITRRGFKPTVFTVPKYTRFTKGDMHVHFEDNRVTVMKFTDNTSAVRDVTSPTPEQLEELIKYIESC